MIRRPRLWVTTAAVLIPLLAVSLYLTLRQREVEVTNVAVAQCQALDHLVQVLEYLVSVSDDYNDREKLLRINIYENFREEQARDIDRSCVDPLDPEVIRDAVREAQ